MCIGRCIFLQVLGGHRRRWGYDNFEGARLTAVQTLPDYYGILGIPRYVSAYGIRRAYVRKSWQFHPDLHPNDPNTSSIMSDINVAYATLSNPATRAAYDARRNTAYIRPSQQQHYPTGVSTKPHYQHRTGGRKRAGVFCTALAMLSRLFGYAAIILPM
jgi:curved DNA-binding protein CbpA